MPKAYQNQQSQNGTSDYTFAALRLTDDQKAHFSGWLKENSQAFEDVIASFTLSGHKISFSFDGEHDCYIASMTCNDKRSANHKMVMTSRAEDWFTAMMMNAYKALVLCEGGAWPKQSSGNNWG